MTVLFFTGVRKAALPPPRWRADLVYRSDKGPVKIAHEFDEIADLDAMIENGPDWRCLVSCMITLNRVDPAEAGPTMEQAAKL